MLRGELTGSEDSKCLHYKQKNKNKCRHNLYQFYFIIIIIINNNTFILYKPSTFKSVVMFTNKHHNREKSTL